MDEQDFRLRAEIIKIQNSLSNDDRKQLHFYFGEDIPRRLQDGSLSSAIDVIQTLLDRLKISKNDVEYLIKGLKAIERHDCAQRLIDYQKLVPGYIIPLEAGECRQPVNVSNNLTLQQLHADMNEEDLMTLPQTDSKPTGFNPPEPIPLDVSKIDLRPFEDSSQPWTKEFSESLHLRYHPRNYQIEIIRDAIRNKNTIVCLRTGSGKTFIASILIKYYYIKKLKSDPDAKFLAFFFVPRKAIRLQQAQAIAEIGNLRVQICEDDQRIDQLINTHVIVATPQKLVNCLEKGTMQLSQIDLMIFDECHNTTGRNPYCEIMKFFLCPSKNQSTGIKPSIIGLTATISSKDANEKKETVDKNLASICSKLGCQWISTVCDENNIEEINTEISRPKNDQFEYVSKVEYNQYFHDYLKIYTNLIEQIKKHLDNHAVLDNHDTGSSGFIGQLIDLKRCNERQGHSDNIIICDYLLLLTKKYPSLYDLPFDMVVNYVLRKIEEYNKAYGQSPPMNDLLHEHCQIGLNSILKQYEQHPTTNSKLNKLVELLKSYAPTNKKGLILVQTTFYAKTLFDYLQTHPELTNIVKPTWIVGQNSSDFSLTIHEQEEQLKKFRENQCNVLVATDIVQEGLDIPTCSYVIRYEFVSDEIGTIQSRGRARAQDSSYYLITAQSSTNHQREMNNKIREDEMEKAIRDWPNLDKDKFRQDVNTTTKTFIEQWEKDIKSNLEQQKMLREVGRKTGTIHCNKCSRELGRIEWLRRRYQSYIINEPAFLKNNDCEIKTKFKSFQENLVVGEVKCTCGNQLGGCQKYTDRLDLGTLCALQCKQIKFKIEGQEKYILIPQWSKNNFFDVEEIEEI